MTPEQICKTNSEHSHQVALFSWCALTSSWLPDLKKLFAIKNEEKSGSKIVGARNKAAGVKAGVPDLFLPVPKNGYHGLFIELKRIGGRLSESQKYKIEQLQNDGYAVVVCEGWEAASKALTAYLTGRSYAQYKMGYTLYSVGKSNC